MARSSNLSDANHSCTRHHPPLIILRTQKVAVRNADREKKDKNALVCNAWFVSSCMRVWGPGTSKTVPE
eukprot:3939221-Rhodomonas_salina.2